MARQIQLVKDSPEAEDILGHLLKPTFEPDAYGYYDRLRSISPIYYSTERQTYYLTDFAANDEMYMSAAFGQGPNGSSLIQSLPAYATSPALQYLAKMTFVMDP